YDVGGAFGTEILDDRALDVGVEVFERVRRALVVERTNDPRGVLRGEFADDVCQFGGMQPGEAMFRDGEADLRRAEVVERRDVVPGDQRARDAIDQSRNDLRRTQPAQQTTDADVCRNDAQRSAGACDLDVA